MLSAITSSLLVAAAMNKLVFKYGDAAKSSNTTLKNQVNVLSPSATALEKSAASTTLEVAKIAINPPMNGTNCDDGNALTTEEKYTSGICANGLFTTSGGLKYDQCEGGVNYPPLKWQAS